MKGLIPYCHFHVQYSYQRIILFSFILKRFCSLLKRYIQMYFRKINSYILLIILYTNSCLFTVLFFNYGVSLLISNLDHTIYFSFIENTSIFLLPWKLHFHEMHIILGLNTFFSLRPRGMANVSMYFWEMGYFMCRCRK